VRCLPWMNNDHPRRFRNSGFESISSIPNRSFLTLLGRSLDSAALL
jgi:hypothetical protein